MKSRMKVLIRYCGGCNPEYRREKVEEILRKNFHSFEFFHSGSKTEADLVVLINGCRKNCLNEEFVRSVCFDSDIDEKDIVERVRRVLSRKN